MLRFRNIIKGKEKKKKRNKEIYTLPTLAGGEASQRPLPGGRDFWGHFCLWQRLVATEHPYGQSRLNFE